MTFRHFFTLCLLWSTALGLLGCGGGSDAKNTGNADGSSATSPVQAGVYFDGSSGHEFWGVITPGNRWYGLNYSTANPDIYSGDLTGTGSLQASIPSLGMKYQNTADIVSNGSATLTSSGNGKLAGILSIPSMASLNFNATTPNTYTYGQAAQLSALAGQWTGQLSFGSGESANFSMTFSADSGALTPGRPFASCIWNASTSTAVPRGDVNLFTLTLHMNNATNCDTDLDGKTLGGIAFITSASSNTQRLIWVAVTPEGHGITFKALRASP
jgi:hypothetical protein